MASGPTVRVSEALLAPTPSSWATRFTGQSSAMRSYVLRQYMRRSQGPS